MLSFLPLINNSVTFGLSFLFSNKNAFSYLVKRNAFI